jgi:hypothetical protein
VAVAVAVAGVVRFKIAKLPFMETALAKAPHSASRLGSSVSATAASFMLAGMLTGMLAGCTAGVSSPAADGVTGTTWSGTDSLERPTVLAFESDGTVEVTYFDDTFNDELDTWSLDGTSISMTVFVSELEGSATYTGIVDTGSTEGDALASMTLEAIVSGTGESFTLDLVRD